MKRFLILLAVLLTLIFVGGIATPAEAHGRGSSAIPIPEVTSDSGLGLSGSMTCSTFTFRMTHPDGQHALLVVLVNGVIVESVEDLAIPGNTDVMAWNDAVPGDFIGAYVLGQEDGDHLWYSGPTLVVPPCSSPLLNTNWATKHGLPHSKSK